MAAFMMRGAMGSMPATGKKGKLHVMPVPKMGKSSTGVVFGWAKKVGSAIKEGDILCHIERGQVTDDIHAPVSGILMECCVHEEGTVKPGEDLAKFDTGAALPDASMPSVELLLQRAQLRTAAAMSIAVASGAGAAGATLPGMPSSFPQQMAALQGMPKLPTSVLEDSKAVNSGLLTLQQQVAQLQAGVSDPLRPPGAMDFHKPGSMLAAAHMSQGPAFFAKQPEARPLSGQSLQRLLAASPYGAQLSSASALASASAAANQYVATEDWKGKATETWSADWKAQEKQKAASWSATDDWKPSSSPAQAAWATSSSPSASQSALATSVASLANFGSLAAKAKEMADKAREQREAATTGQVPAAAAVAAAVAAATAAANRAKGKAAPPQKANAEAELEKLRCHLHTKHYNACKNCKKYLAAKTAASDEASAALQARKPKGKAEELQFNCSPLLKERVVNSSFYKSLFAIEDVEGLLKEIKEFATDTLDVYMTSTEPSCFMCCVYRLFTMSISDDRLKDVIDNEESVIARCVGLLYIRFTLPPEQLWDRLEEFVLDDEEIELTEGPAGEIEKNHPATIGEYVEELLLKEKYFSTPLPRLPAGVRRKLEEGLAPMGQYRKRAMANQRIFGTRDPRMAVEVVTNGAWAPGQALAVLRNIPSRPRIRVQLDNGPEFTVHLGKVVVTEPPAANRERSRSRGRNQREGSPDWSRHKGRSDTELVEELRERAREDAVCSDRRGYAKRLPRFEVGLAMNREKGGAEQKLIEEETFIHPSQRRRKDSTTAGHEDFVVPGLQRTEEEDEHKQRLQSIFEKYGQQKPESKGSSHNDIDGPDTLRLG